ncbi:alpha/beta hydrolase [Roseovarius sp. CAU 1744]|uniref:alpha/beta fold hydrolase n=1 Tax=Roseovarius sp. CAU 1744 TaxID=3140368 RepID=UPI00325A5216
MTTIPGFTDHRVTLEDVEIAYSVGGDGPPVLLLHGYPQTRSLWRQIAPALARSHTVICPDLRGYGQSSKPKDVAAYSFRAMARDQTALLRHLGISSAAVIGHDRGARVTHRLALDAPEVVSRLALLDIIPTHTLLADLRREVAVAYYHWFFLAQPEPAPETMILADPDRYYHSCLLGWGGATLDDFDPEQLEAYRTAWRDPETTRGMCNDYRAAIRHDFDDDAADLDARIACPVHILFGADGTMARAYDVPATWAPKCTEMTAQAIPGGHFFPDTNPGDTRDALRRFLT